jgi:hypothetical protein
MFNIYIEEVNFCPQQPRCARIMELMARLEQSGNYAISPVMAGAALGETIALSRELDVELARAPLHENTCLPCDRRPRQKFGIQKDQL